MKLRAYESALIKVRKFQNENMKYICPKYERKNSALKCERKKLEKLCPED